MHTLTSLFGIHVTRSLAQIIDTLGILPMKSYSCNGACGSLAEFPGDTCIKLTTFKGLASPTIAGKRGRGNPAQYSDDAVVVALLCICWKLRGKAERLTDNADKLKNKAEKATCQP